MHSRLHNRTGGRFVLLALAVLLPAGCGGDTATKKTDDATLARLERLASDEPVVLACRMKTVPDAFPLGTGGRELSRGRNGILVQVPRSEVDRIAALPGVEGVAVWGTAEQVQKMDFWLQAQILNAWSQKEPLTLSCLARFAAGTAGLRDRLEGMGATPRTVAGPVVTLDAGPDALLEIVQMPELVSMTQPRMLTPSPKQEPGGN
jgi:hypothetical protein